MFELIRRHIAEEGYPPSVRQLGDAVGLRTGSAVVHQLRQLEMKGYIERVPGQARAIRLLPDLASPAPAALPIPVDELVMDLTDVWQDMSPAEIGDVTLAEFLQLRPAEQVAWVERGVLPPRLRPYWRLMHRLLLGGSS